jgi:hypothetical protein
VLIQHIQILFSPPSSFRPVMSQLFSIMTISYSSLITQFIVLVHIPSIALSRGRLSESIIENKGYVVFVLLALEGGRFHVKTPCLWCARVECTASVTLQQIYCTSSIFPFMFSIQKKASQVSILISTKYIQNRMMKFCLEL